MANLSTNSVTSHALAVFRCSSKNDTSGSLAALALWQQQQPCRLSRALQQWFDAQTNGPQLTSSSSDDALEDSTRSQSSVYSDGASAFDLFASNGGNVCCGRHFFATEIILRQPRRRCLCMTTWPPISLAFAMIFIRRIFWISGLGPVWRWRLHSASGTPPPLPPLPQYHRLCSCFSNLPCLCCLKDFYFSK